jgi:phosphoserine phosphatase
MSLLLGSCLLVNWLIVPLAVAADTSNALDASAERNVDGQLQALEQRRLAALKDRDAAALQSVLADDYVHIHSTGRVDDRAAFIKGTLERPRRSENSP